MKVSHDMRFRDSQTREKLWYSATHFILQQETPSYPLWASLLVRHLQLRCMCRSWRSSFKRPLAWLTQPVGCQGVKTMWLYQYILLCWVIFGIKLVFVWFCLGWFMNSSAGNIVSFLSFSMFHPVSFVFCPASFILRPVSFNFGRCLSVFKQYELGAIFILCQTHCLETSFQVSSLFVTKHCAKPNCFEAESVRVRADLSFCSFPSSGHHPMVWLSTGLGAVRSYGCIRLEGQGARIRVSQPNYLSTD